MKTPSGEYQRAVWVYNPKSSSQERMRRELAKLRKVLPVTELETSKELARTQESVYREAESGDLLFGATGDGGSNQILNIIRLAKADGHVVHGLPFVPLRGGYANDAAVMLNGRRRAAQIIQSGRNVACQPLESVITSPDGTAKTRWAMSQFGAAGSGYASLRIEQVKASSKGIKGWAPVDLSRKAIASWLAIADHPQLKMLTDEGEQLISDITAPRGNIVAKYGHPHANLMDSSGFEFIASSPTGRFDALADMIRMHRGKLCGEMVAERCFQLDSLNGQPFYIHHDGEPTLAASGSIIDLHVASDSYNTLSTTA